MSEEPVEYNAPPKASAPPHEEEADLKRRDFLSKAGSIGLGAVIVAVPAGAGIATLLSPMMDGASSGLTLRLTSVDELPEDGTPRLFQVVAERKDAWTKYPAKPLGSVFIRKDEAGKVVAYNTSCPHAGCSVGFKSMEEGYYCPCHSSTFLLDGTRGEVCVSPRGLDELKVDQDKLAIGEVWVTFQNFKAGVEDKVPV